MLTEEPLQLPLTENKQHCTEINVSTAFSSDSFAAKPNRCSNTGNNPSAIVEGSVLQSHQVKDNVGNGVTNSNAVADTKERHEFTCFLPSNEDQSCNSNVSAVTRDQFILDSTSLISKALDSGSSTENTKSLLFPNSATSIASTTNTTYYSVTPVKAPTTLINSEEVSPVLKRSRQVRNKITLLYQQYGTPSTPVTPLRTPCDALRKSYRPPAMKRIKTQD